MAVSEFLFTPFSRNFWVSRWDDIEHFLSQLINFKVSALTGSRSYLFGFLPSFSTICMLLLTCASLAVAPWLLATVAQGASAYMPFYAATVAGVVLYGIGSYWFDGPNKVAEYKATPLNNEDTYGPDNGQDELDLSKLVQHAYCLVLAGERVAMENIRNSGDLIAESSMMKKISF